MASIPQQLTRLFPAQPGVLARQKWLAHALWHWEGSGLPKPWLFLLKNFIDVYLDTAKSTFYIYIFNTFIELGKLVPVSILNIISVILTKVP